MIYNLIGSNNAHIVFASDPFTIIMISYLPINVGDNKVSSVTGDVVEPGELLSQLHAAVGLPASLFERIDDQPNIGVFFAFYQSSSLFPVGSETNISSSPIRNVVGSQVLAATVGSGINFQNLSEAVTIIFRLQVPEGSVS